jgi:hypothetical protein
MLPSLVLASALAATPKVAIVDVDAPDLMMGLGAQVTRALVAEAQAQHLDLLEPDALRQKLDAKRYEGLRKCGGKPACVAQELEGTGAERAVLGSLGRDEKNYLLKLWLIDLKKLSVLADVDRSILIAARRLQKDVEQAVPPFLRGEQEARGTLVVEANLQDAQVFLNGEFLGTPPLTHVLRPGKHEVKVARTKYLPITRLVDLEPNKETKVFFKLLLVPGQVPDEPLGPALPKKKGDEGAAPATMVLSPLTWVLGGAAIAAGGAGLGFGLVARGQESTLREGYDAATEVYAGTRALALEQNRNALIANVSFGVAGAALVGAVISGIVDGTRAAPAVQVAPAASATGAGISLGGSF